MSGAWFRVLTPGGIGGIAVVQVGGAGAAEILTECVGRVPRQPGAVVVGAFQSAAGGIDQVLAAWPAAPGTPCFEIHCHGGTAIVAAICARLHERGARAAAAPPETAAEVLHGLLLRAPSREAAALVLEQATAQLLPQLRQLAADLAAGRAPDPAAWALVAARAAVGRAHFEPFTVALWGQKNAGKSALLNRLLGAERALSGSEPGLTRDAVIETTCLGGYPVRLVDLPGLGPGGDAFDAEALRRAAALWAAADLGVVVVDPAHGVGEHERGLLAAPDRAWLLTKVDQAAAGLRPSRPLPGSPPLLVVRGDREDLAPLVRRMFGAALRSRRGLPVAGPAGHAVPLTAGLEQALAALAEELVAGDVCVARVRLARLLGDGQTPSPPWLA